MNAAGVCVLVAIALAGLVTSLALLPSGTLPAPTPPPSATPPPTTTLPPSATPPPSVITAFTCVCSACDDYRNTGVCLQLSTSAICETQCIELGCTGADFQTNSSVCPTGACCGEPERVTTQDACHATPGFEYAGDEVATCAQRGSCCVVGSPTLGYCVNGVSAADCLRGRSLSNVAVYSRSACASTSTPCVSGAPLRVPSLSCCALSPTSCTADLNASQCETRLDGAGVFFEGGACLRTGACL